MIIRCLNQVRKFCSATNNTNIMKYLCVAEKNDAAKTISGFLSRGQSQRREGISQYNKIYEFEMDFRGQKAKIVFTSVSGHLLTYMFSNAYKNWKGCNPEQLFEAPVTKGCPENFQKIQQTLEREIRSCNGLIIWTDCDREGENIGYEIIDVCRAVKPNITVQRAKFSDMTAASITRAMNTLIQPDERVSNAVNVRSELDLRIGAAFTRFQTMRLQSVFPEKIDSVVSYGSCQIPTLGFVVQRYKEIQNFIARSFWKVKLTHKIDKLTVEFNWSRNRLFDKPCVEAFLMLCQADGEVMITNVLQKPKNKWRPQPMDTVELEKTGSRKLKLSAKVIMTIAEKLYTQGFISYPRTETNKFSKDINLRPLVEMQVQDADWGGFANRVLQWGPSPRNGNKSDQAHPPIHPTKYAGSLQGNEKRVYELVVRHFLACVSRDAVGSETVVNATIGKEDFTATGLVILERNYLDVYTYDRWSGKEIHHYEVGHTFRPTELSLHEGATNPPGMLTEADLIALMEKHGIGTDATHAEHIATIKDRGYIGEQNQELLPGTLGMGLVEGYELMNLQLAQPKLRAGLEEDLKAICNGLKNPEVVLAEQIQKYKECYQIIEREARSLDQALGQRFGQQPLEAPNPQIEMPSMIELFKCPKCQTSSMIIRQMKDNNGSFISCQGFPQCRNAIWLQDGVKELSAVDETCAGCGGQNKKVKLKFTQMATLGLVDEVPAYSRIEGMYYITCIICDDKLRTLLNIQADRVKVLGNIVGASTRPVQQNNHHSIARDPPARGFSTNANPGNQNQQQNQRGGWFNGSDDDDDRPAGGGAVSFANNQVNSRNQGWNSTATTSNSSNSNQGWNSTTSGTSNSYGNQRWNPTANPVKNSSNQSWNNPGSSAAISTNKKVPPVNLSKLPNVKCKCNKSAGRLITRNGANTGRPFYNCATRACKFFQWADVPAPNAVEPSTSYNSVATSSTGTAGRRKCGVCRQEGHNKKNCPNVQII